MKKEITLILELVLQLKQKYTTSNCTQCLVMQDYFKSEYQSVKLKLQNLEKLTVSNDTSCKLYVEEAQKESAILGPYVMV